MTSYPKRYWIALHPDIKKPIGGVKQIHRLAESLSACGREAIIIQERADFHPGWFESEVKTISSKEWFNLKNLSKERDVVVLPETFLPILPNYRPGLPKILFNQNGAYSFGLGKKNDGFPDNPQKVLELYQHSDLKHIICVSQYDLKLIHEIFGIDYKRITCLINAIETNLFKPSGNKKSLITYMPRKNQRDSAIVSTIINSKNWFKGFEIMPIHGVNQQKVVELLQRSIGFLAFGHPEGFGLPLAEAAACGCALIGYSGLGGQEIFELASKQNIGWEVKFGDWQGFIHGTNILAQEFRNNPNNLSVKLQTLSNEIRSIYSFDNMIASVRKGLEAWESQLI